MNLNNFENRLYYSVVSICGNITQGTGFFFEYTSSNKSRFTFIITNKHVVSNSSSGDMTLLASKYPFPNKEILDGYVFNIHIPTNNWENGWLFHPDESIDIAIMNFTPIEKASKSNGEFCFYTSLCNKDFLHRNDLNNFSAIEEILTVGYPFQSNNHLKHFYPIARRGVTASPIYLNKNNETKFLIDSQIFKGASGSPICLKNQKDNSYYLAGLLCGAKIRNDDNTPLNLGECIFSEYIEQTILHHLPQLEHNFI